MQDFHPKIFYLYEKSLGKHYPLHSSSYYCTQDLLQKRDVFNILACCDFFTFMNYKMHCWDLEYTPNASILLLCRTKAAQFQQRVWQVEHSGFIDFQRDLKWCDYLTIVMNHTGSLCHAKKEQQLNVISWLLLYVRSNAQTGVKVTPFFVCTHLCTQHVMIIRKSTNWFGMHRYSTSS